jgi:hypothetical protein
MLVARYVFQILLGVALTYALERWDRGRLTEEQRARAWNTATWGVALFWFGPLSLLPWGWVTRRFPGLLLGFVALAAVSVTVGLADWAFAFVFDLPLDGGHTTGAD